MMSAEDAFLPYLIYYGIVPLAAAYIVLRIIKRYAHTVLEMTFAFFYSRLYILFGLESILKPHKIKLFAQMKMQKSKDPDLRKIGAIRILEIGIGHGTNFAYYPKNSRLVCYDPNPNFRKIMFERHKDFPEIHLERLVVSGGESLLDVVDDSVDAVVTSFALCSVRDLKSVLSEVQRVLNPEGKYYFLEHVIAPEGTFTRRLQKLVNPIWKILYVGCNVTRDLEAEIRPCGFSKVNVKNFTMNFKKIIVGYVLEEAILGTAEK